MPGVFGIHVTHFDHFHFVNSALYFSSILFSGTFCTPHDVQLARRASAGDMLPGDLGPALLCTAPALLGVTAVLLLGAVPTLAVAGACSRLASWRGRSCCLWCCKWRAKEEDAEDEVEEDEEYFIRFRKGTPRASLTQQSTFRSLFSLSSWMDLRARKGDGVPVGRTISPEKALTVLALIESIYYPQDRSSLQERSRRAAYRPKRTRSLPSRCL